MSTDGKYDGVNLLPAFQHKFISYYEALEVHRLLIKGTLIPITAQNMVVRSDWSREHCHDLFTKVKNLGRTISLETRFPDNELYYDLNESVLGSLFYHIVGNYENTPMHSRKYTHADYDKFESKILNILTTQSTDDPLRGVYTRQSFEKKFNLYFNGTHYTLMPDYENRKM